MWYEIINLCNTLVNIKLINITKLYSDFEIAAHNSVPTQMFFNTCQILFDVSCILHKICLKNSAKYSKFY